MDLISRLRNRQEWQFFGVLGTADKPLAVAWWALLALRGLLPAAMAVVTGVLVGAVQHGDPLTGPLVAVGVIFVAASVVNPIHLAVSTNVGDRTAAWLYDELTRACTDPPG